jgi:hypothetical protein
MRNFSVPGVILQILLSEPRGILFRLNDGDFRGGACENSHAGRMKRQGNFSSCATHPENSSAADHEKFVTRKTRPSDCAHTQQQIATLIQQFTTLMERTVFNGKEGLS